MAMSEPSTQAGALLSIAGLFGGPEIDADLRDVHLAMEPVRAAQRVYSEAEAHATAEELAGLRHMVEHHLLVVGG